MTAQIKVSWAGAHANWDNATNFPRRLCAREFTALEIAL